MDCLSFSQKKIIFFSYLILLFFFSSCVTQRNLEYLQHNNKTPVTLIEAEFPEYKLKPNDALYIQIKSLDDAASNVFAQPSVQESRLEPYGAYMNSFTVDKEGFVQLPIIGKINVAGKTTTEVSELIKNSVTNILSLPTVTVRLVNRYVSILGEVRNPGHFVYSQDKLTIYDAIGLAGDINVFGNRSKVTLTRNENGKNIITNIDLTRADILASPYYFIQPNDLIYVSPMTKRFWAMQQFPYSIILSTLTTALVIFSFIQNQ
jgi:polysaccharide export outer membrane protein